MAIAFPDLTALYDHGFDTVIDVRSPAEFAEDRIPGAINLPALSDDERARVGTIYVQDDPFKARKIGAALVARNAAAHIETVLAEKEGGWRPLVYCWRGGQRSGSFTTILQQIGWRAEVIDGGYRAYRRLVKRALYDTEVAAPVWLLDGFTGTAKTELLARVAARGGQVIDLEGLANHRGSIFGDRAGGQPAQKDFESRLARALAALDPARPVLVEAESSKVGTLGLPPMLWKAMRAAPAIRLSAPVQARARYLLGAYGDVTADAERLDAILLGLTKLQGRERIAAWRDLAEAGELHRLAEELMVHHYDPRYAALRRDGTPPRAEIAMGHLDARDLDRAAGEILRVMEGG